MRVAAAAFGDAPLDDPEVLEELHAHADGFDFTAEQLRGGLVPFLVGSALYRSNGEARRAIEQGGLRLGVQGGGCSGLSYNVRFDTQPRERDRIFQFSDIRVFVDPKSFIYLNGMTLDYQETPMQQGFVFVNPQASKSCGCGTSFSA